MNTIFEFLSESICPDDVVLCSAHESGSVTVVLFCCPFGDARRLARSQVALLVARQEFGGCTAHCPCSVR